MYIGKTYSSKNVKRHNNNILKNIAKYKKELIEGATYSELLFGTIAGNMGITYLKFQYVIQFRNTRGKIYTFKIVDYCDTSRKIIFEIDGRQHYRDGILILEDIIRTHKLESLGYTVYRIKNEDVAFKTRELLESIYY